ncbi:MAG: GNAT family N-acetyltransferase [Bdellovibrionales bacterium]|nr:GNAT family N-acetyltransferase [Bdellovibrionales bacterium]
MRLIKHSTSEEFIEMNEKFLIQKESFHNLKLGLVYGIKAKTIIDTAPLYYSIVDGEQSSGCAVRSNNDRPLTISEMSKAAVDLLISDLIKNNVVLEGIVGEENTATYFKDQWIKLNPVEFKINLHLGVYECLNIILPRIDSEEIISAEIEHTEIVKIFMKGFGEDCFPDKPFTEENLEALLKRHLGTKSLYLLKNINGDLVSMAANTRSTLKGGTISLVYTPPKYRGKGYGSKMVALLSKKIMENGKSFTNLFTDLSNPTSNSIYQKVGYVKIGQNIHFDFKQI